LQYQSEHHGITGIDHARHGTLNSELSVLQKAYFSHQPVDYDTCERIVAYALHYAAKHAAIWRSIASIMKIEGQDEFVLNSIGTGPGSEVFGMLCGMPGIEALQVRFVGLEREGAWRDLFEIARTEFAAKTGIILNGFLTNDPRNLEREGVTIGSFVLSDAARRSEVGTLLTAIREAVAVQEVYFLDFAVYTTSDGTSEFVTVPIQKAGFKVTVSSLNDDHTISKAIRQEMDRCRPIYCRRPIRDNLPLKLYRVQLR
jgi:hypothetical protein